MFEPLALFVRDEILEPIFGHHAGHYLPYFLTLFFFLLTCNLLGLAVQDLDLAEARQSAVTASAFGLQPDTETALVFVERR